MIYILYAMTKVVSEYMIQRKVCWRLVDGRVFEDDDDGDDEYFPGNGARKQLDGYVLVNPKRKVMM